MNIKGKKSEKGLKIKMFELDNSNPYRGQFSWETLQKVQNLCNDYCVKDVKFIEHDTNSTYVVVVYKEWEWI